MGSTSTHLPYGQTIREFFTKKFDRESDHATYKILASSLIRFHTWYAAMEIIPKITEKREVIGVVVHVSMML